MSVSCFRDAAVGVDESLGHRADSKTEQVADRESVWQPIPLEMTGRSVLLSPKPSSLPAALRLAHRQAG